MTDARRNGGRSLELSGFMGFFSFGKKDDAPRRRSASAKSPRSGGTFEAREERRGRRKERTGDVDAMLLDPTLPEKQRARRRLVGAIALVVAAVVILPMVLDSHPKPITDDIAIDIPNRPATVPSRASDDNPQDTQAGVAPDRADMSGGANSAADGIAPAPAAVAPGKAAPQSASGAQANATQAERKPADSKQADSKQGRAPSTTAAPTNAAQTAKPTALPAPSPAEADSGTPAAPAGARYAVQLGVFADDANARAWEKKLKAAGVPAYIEHRTQADGKTRSMLRAGPFADRSAASAAIAKVREAGLAAGAGNGSQ